MKTATELLEEAVIHIKNSASARLDAEVLLCHVIDCNRTTIYSQPERPIPDDQSVRFQSLIEKRRNGHPIAYLTGKKEFWSLDLSVNQSTLIPRTETECLVEAALQMIPDDSAFNILELGTGSGAIAIAIASERPDCNILATDIDPQALNTAEKNAATHHINHINFLCSDWYKNIPLQLFDMIISNPPYIAQYDKHLFQSDIQFEPDLALVSGADGMQAINIIVKNAKNYLAGHGYFFIEHGYNQQALVNQCFLKNGFKKTTTLCDLSGHQRITYGM